MIFGDPLWAEALSLANVLFSLALAYFCARSFLIESGWNKVLYGILTLIGLYWMGVYLFVIFTAPGMYDSVAFGRAIIRPAFTFTLSTMASVALFRWASRPKR